MVNGCWCLDSDCPQLSESADSKSADNDKRCSEFEELSYKRTNWNSFCALKLAIMTGFEEQTCNCAWVFVNLWNPASFFCALIESSKSCIERKTPYEMSSSEMCWTKTGIERQKTVDCGGFKEFYQWDRKGKWLLPWTRLIVACQIITSNRYTHTICTINVFKKVKNTFLLSL